MLTNEDFYNHKMKCLQMKTSIIIRWNVYKLKTSIIIRWNVYKLKLYIKVNGIACVINYKRFYQYSIRDL